MKVEEFLCGIKNDYFVIKVMSDRNGTRVLLLKHKKIGRRMVLRLQGAKQEIYCFLKGISFENLPEVYDTFVLEDAFAVLEEYIDGISVAQVLESGLYTYRGAKKVIWDVCDALNVLHENGYVHRDIKPENIMVSSDGTVKLIDFNVSRSVKESVGHDTVIMGTVGYAPPEQLGISQSDSRTDLYALGVLLNVMLTGKHPSEALVSGRARHIVLKCTQIAPEKRFRNVLELKNAL
ncbi:MAG: serine/threonine protein kinase [Candidatus Avispirillum sp.]